MFTLVLFALLTSACSVKIGPNGWLARWQIGEVWDCEKTFALDETTGAIKCKGAATLSGDGVIAPGTDQIIEGTIKGLKPFLGSL